MVKVRNPGLMSTADSVQPCLMIHRVNSICHCHIYSIWNDISEIKLMLKFWPSCVFQVDRQSRAEDSWTLVSISASHSFSGPQLFFHQVTSFSRLPLRSYAVLFLLFLVIDQQWVCDCVLFAVLKMIIVINKNLTLINSRQCSKC